MGALPLGFRAPRGGGCFAPRPYASRDLRACVVAALALVLAAALVCLAPSASAWADGGSVELGVSVESAGAGASAGGSVELSAKVKAASDAASGGRPEEANTVYLGIGVKNAQVHWVSLVGYYCDEKGDVVTDEDGAQKKETIEVQSVLHGGHATVPANLERTDDAGGKYWVDGWYAYDEKGQPQKVSLADYEVTGGATLFCYWKKGYAVMLDPNNGADADGEPVFDGSVDGGASCVAVERDVAFEEGGGTGNPDGYTAPAFPAATRPGYVFKGWYWAEEGKADSFGRAELANAKGDPVASSGDTKGYDFFRESCAGGAVPTLYAKWELAPLVKVELQDAAGAGTDKWVRLWFWPGRGYALSQPAADKEAEAGFVIGRGDVPAEGLDVTVKLGVAMNPRPKYATQVFSGWGYAVQGESGKLETVELVGCEKAAGESGSDGADEKKFVYTLSPRVFDYVNDDMQWTDHLEADNDPSAPVGQMKTTWEALFDAARISVTAPFEVTFQKKGTNWTSDKTDVGAYSLDELDGLDGKKGWNWVESIEQEFSNRSSAGSGDASVPVSVYISGIECVDTGAGAVFPSREGAPDKKVFSLYENALLGGGAGGSVTADKVTGGTAIRFGYSGDRDANRVVVDASKPESWIELEPVGDAKFSKQLYFGLDLSKVRLNRAAIALGGTDGSDAGGSGEGSDESGSGEGSGEGGSGEGAGGSRYVAPLANVKYTYSVAP